jgi:hypothetical protein
MASNAQPPFFISMFDADRDRLRLWAVRAAALGIGEDFRRALTTIVDGLQTDPLNFGDPLFNYQHMGAVLCHAMRWPLRVHYAVDETHRTVFVQRFSVVPVPPLEQDQA